MQLKDVVVGEAYEYQKWSGYPKRKVVVIEVGVQVPYYSYKGALIQHENGKREAVVARCLLRTWAAVEKQNERMDAESVRLKAIVIRLHDARIGIESALSRAGVTAVTSIYETSIPSLIIKFKDPAEAERFAKMIGGGNAIQT